jgi:hypothetical protein
MILIPGISTSTSGRSIQTNMVTPQRFLANSIYTGVHTERQVQFGFCAFNRILRHYTMWAFVPLMPRCSKRIQIKSPTTIIQLWAMYAIVARHATTSCFMVTILQTYCYYYQMHSQSLRFRLICTTIFYP